MSHGLLHGIEVESHAMLYVICHGASYRIPHGVCTPMGYPVGYTAPEENLTKRSVLPGISHGGAYFVGVFHMVSHGIRHGLPTWDPIEEVIPRCTTWDIP